MKKALKKIPSATYYYKDYKRVEGVPDDIRGDLTYIRGDLTYITGDLTGIRGNLTGITGDIDDCEITAEERVAGISVEDLIED